MLIELLKAVLFGIVEGITEWLPISSTGHMILLDEFIKLNVSDAFYKMFQVVIQLGAIGAVIVLFFHKLNPFSPQKNPKQKHNTWVLWFKVIVAVLPSAVLGLLLDDWMDAHLYNYIVVAIALRFDLPASALKLVSAIIVAVAISYPTLMKMVDFQQKKLASRGKDLYRIMLAVFAACCLICVLLTVLLPGSRALFILLAVLLAIGIVWAAVRERKLKKGGAAKC